MNANKNQEGQCGCKTGRSSSGREWEAGKKEKEPKTWRSKGWLVGEQREKGRHTVTMIVTTSEYYKLFPQRITVLVKYKAPAHLEASEDFLSKCGQTVAPCLPAPGDTPLTDGQASARMGFET